PGSPPALYRRTAPAYRNTSTGITQAPAARIPMAVNQIGLPKFNWCRRSNTRNAAAHADTMPNRMIAPLARSRGIGGAGSGFIRGLRERRPTQRARAGRRPPGGLGLPDNTRRAGRVSG